MLEDRNGSNEPNREALYDEAQTLLAALELRLAAERKVLRRDWEQLTPGERSAGTRVVKQLEAEQRELLDRLQMYQPES